MKKTAIYQRKRVGGSQWFNKWVQSPLWFLGFWIAVLVCLAVYVLNVLFGDVRPGSAWGLSYGIVAAVLFVAVFLYALKRRTMRLRALGRAWYYLQFHVYAGALALLLMFMHIGFQVPHGILTWWLWFLSIWTVASGILGIVLQKWIPTLLNSGLETEVHYDRIPELVEDLGTRAEKLVSGADYNIREFYQRNLAPAFAAPRARAIYFLDVSAGIQSKTRHFEHLREVLSPEVQPTVDELQSMYQTKLEIDAHYSLQRALRWWLYLHVPFSVVMLVLLCIHIFSVLYW